jgi:hypothetical protein
MLPDFNRLRCCLSTAVLVAVGMVVAFIVADPIVSSLESVRAERPCTSDSVENDFEERELRAMTTVTYHTSAARIGVKAFYLR